MSTEINRQSDFDGLDVLVDGVQVNTLFFNPNREANDPEAILRSRRSRLAALLTALENASDETNGLRELNLDYEEERTRVLDIVNRIKAGNGPFGVGSGIPGWLTGVGTIPILKVIEQGLAPLSQFHRCRGKIRDYIFEAEPLPSDYVQPDVGIVLALGSGHLTVETRFDLYHSYLNFQNDEPDRIEIYHWDIDVPNGLYQVRQREGDVVNNPNDPFPGTVSFPPAATDPLDPSSVWFRNLDHKLFARGQQIDVRNVFEQIIEGEASSFRRLPDGHPVYTSDDDSCIDLMLADVPPARQLPQQSGYCLGRCGHPAILNTEAG